MLPILRLPTALRPADLKNETLRVTLPELDKADKVEDADVVIALATISSVWRAPHKAEFANLRDRKCTVQVQFDKQTPAWLKGHNSLRYPHRRLSLVYAVHYNTQLYASLQTNQMLYYASLLLRANLP